MKPENTWSPVFIGGFRSGSTLLINLLGMQKEAAVLYETKSICEALRWIKVLNDPASIHREQSIISQFFPMELHGFRKELVAERMELQMKYTWDRVRKKVADAKASYEKYPLGSDYILYDFKEAKAILDIWIKDAGEANDRGRILSATGRLIESIGAAHARKVGKMNWINKTPELPRMGVELRQSVGKCKIVHIIRDGKEVVRSAKNLGWGSVECIAENWRDIIKDSRQAAKNCPEDYLEVRFEDLVSDTSATLNRVLAFIGLAENGEELVNKFNGYGTGRIRPRGVWNWFRRLRGKDLKTFNRIAGDLQSDLGYK